MLGTGYYLVVRTNDGISLQWQVTGAKLQGNGSVIVLMSVTELHDVRSDRS
jgi:hypothetical protein